MSAPKNRSGRPAAPAVAVAATPTHLTEDEKLLLSSYRASSEDGRYYALAMAVSMADFCRRHKRPTLKLVRGGTE